MGIYVNTFGTSKVRYNDGELAKIVDELFDMRPYFIEKRLKLRNQFILKLQHMVTWVVILKSLKKFLHHQME